MKSRLTNLKNAIEVWNIRLPDHRTETDRLRTLLSNDELERAGKFIRPSDAQNFILCRGLLRRILADCLGADPSIPLRFTRNEQGKPFLENGGLEFNVSHSRDRLLIAVTSGRAVGVDIEFRRGKVNMQAIAERWFSPDEQMFFQGLKNPEDGFFEIWSKKEACVKALGIGIFKELSSFSVPLGGPPFSPILGTDGQWFFQPLNVDPAYTAAVVSEAPIVPVYLRQRSCDRN
ncbi:MAG: 4'-phosphopantetheinyl transferase superfamily protein [Pontiellaceae bacterium]|jgi:4'-phosphopantetheinyl transferase|nr:4'-phosphopantetheinyl transferase superfamily protein [Pontiellaceae bacterium]